MTSRSDAFFAWVWRLNGLAILGVAFVCLVGAVVVVLDIALSSDPETPEESLVQVAGSDVGTENLRLFDFTPIAGSDLLYAKLAAQDEYVSSGLSKGYSTARNILFFDTQTKRAHWLFPDHEQEIPSLVFLKDPPGLGHMWETGESTKEGQRVVGLLVEWERRATPGTDKKPLREIALAAPDGRSLEEIASSSQGLLGYHQVGADSLFVFHVAGGEARVLEIDPATREVRLDSALSAEH